MERDLIRCIGEKQLGIISMDLMSHVHQTTLQREIVPLRIADWYIVIYNYTLNIPVSAVAV